MVVTASNEPDGYRAWALRQEQVHGALSHNKAGTATRISIGVDVPGNPPDAISFAGGGARNGMDSACGAPVGGWKLAPAAASVDDGKVADAARNR